MAKKNKKVKEDVTVHTVSIEFTLKLDNNAPAVQYFNVLNNEVKKKLLEGTVYSALMNSNALYLVNAGNSWAELNLSPLAEEG